ncbi:hypothetical protein CHS0354_034921 [Potamilus streckersoni]|uniref:Uncharacterized protein n=1 Tax=Potamilus streckersoni TaxID=2493646 RepID=A0AAE0SDX3_9BIVA|nr:hypothetical protein CHS0354_034921 [Potamilus streckersoni]
MSKLGLILLCYICYGQLTWGAETFDIYVVVEEEAKVDVFKELSEKYEHVEEQSFFLHNKALLVAKSKRKITGLKSFQSSDDKVTDDIQLFRQRPHVFLSNKVELLQRHVKTNDSQWSNMWQINGAVSPTMKVLEAWEVGYNGSGIIVSIVDDGLQTDHIDLAVNVREIGHYDVVDNDFDPNPPFLSKHGTQVAGFIAAERDNNICIVGVAYSSTLIGIRLIDNGYTTDINEAKAIAHGYSVTDISSNSWGPPESYGYYAPGALTTAAFELGINQGRGGKGVIYVWAAGNGGITDNCNADGYANSIYTVTISSVDINGQPAWYSEVCAPALAVTYSGDRHQRYMNSTSNANRCSGGIEGTSFSVPQAAGMVALAIQANSDLTWRDVQHLIVKTAKYHNLKEADDYGFRLNGAGNYVGQMFGYGLMDAEAMVMYAKTWKTVSKQEIYKSNASTPYGVLNSTSATMSDYILVETSCPINYLEHVQVHTTFQCSGRGYVELELVSPAGTWSKLMSQRRYDIGDSRQQEWTFMSIQFWGEDPKGNWTFSIKIPSSQTGNLTAWQLILYGTTEDPLAGIPTCDESPCENGGSCVSKSKYDISICLCAPGYTGKKCETDINECENAPCNGDAACVDLINAYNCTCPSGFVYNYTSDPSRCQDINECDISPCAGNSTCENIAGGYVCQCPMGYVYNGSVGDCSGSAGVSHLVIRHRRNGAARNDGVLPVVIADHAYSCCFNVVHIGWRDR